MSQQPRLFYGWVIVATALVMMAVGYALRNTFSVFYPVLVAEFGWDRGNTALMFSINVLVYGITAPIAGGLIDRFNPRLVFTAGVCLMGGAIALCSMASQQWHFYLLYGAIAACGLSLCGTTPLAALVSRWFIRRRALAFGIYNMGFGVSLLASPAAQSLISDLGWRQAYSFIGLAAIAIVAPLALLLVRHSPADLGTVPDGATTPDDTNQRQAVQSYQTPWMRVDWTMRRALRTRQFWLLFFTATCLLGLAQQVIITHSVYLFQDCGFAPQLAANSFSFYGVGITIGYLFANLSDRIGREHVLVPACLVSAAGTSLLFTINGAAQFWVAFASMFLCGLGMGAAVTTFFATVADLFQGRNYGSIQGLITFGFSIGGAFSPWFAGHLQDITGSYSPAVAMVVAGLAIAALLVILSAPRTIRPVAGMMTRTARQR